MRELLIKNSISKDKKRTELFLSERFEKGEIIQEIEKRTVYKVKEILEFADVFDLELFLNRKKNEDSFLQRFIVRHRATRAGREQFIYKIVGEQYVIAKDKVFILKVSQYVKKTILLKDNSEKFIAEKS